MPAHKKNRTAEEEQARRDNLRDYNREYQRNRRKRLRDAEQDTEEHELYQQRRQNAQARRRQRQLDIQNAVDNHEHYLGEMNVLCVHCNAKHFASEKVSNKGNSFNDCCCHGAVHLENIPDFPVELRALFQGTDDNSKTFFDHIRNYNSLYSFASFNANLVNFEQRRGPYCFKIQGQIYYQINEALYPEVTDNPTYGQLFIVDPQEAINYRIAANPNANRVIINSLERLMREYNILAQSYVMMKQEIDHQRELNGIEPELQLLFTLKPGCDRNRYNFQRTNEIAVVFSTSADGDIPESYVTIGNKNTKSLKTISLMSSCVEPMVYPLFYPHGTHGWHRNLMKRKVNATSNVKSINHDNYDIYEESSRRVTRASYIKYRKGISPDEFNGFLLGRRLYQQ